MDSYVRTILESRNASCPDCVPFDGNVHRCSDKDKPHGNDIAFLVRADGSGWVENHRDGKGRESFQPDGEACCFPSDDEIEKRRNEFEAAQRAASEKAAECLKIFKPAPTDHPYLIRKNVKSYGLLQDDVGNLVVPMRDFDGQYKSLQRIATDGSKKFFSGAPAVNLFFVIGEASSSSIVFIAEGYATAASIYEAVGVPVIVAFNCINIGPVARIVRAKRPHSKIIIAADDDKKTEKKLGRNPGISAAKDAASEVKGSYVSPQFSDKNESLSDFNDLYCSEGIEVVRSQLHKAMNVRTKDEHRRVSMANVFDAERMVVAYEEYLRGFKNNRFITGIENIDRAIRGVGGGEVLTVIARAGSFKTAMLQNMLKNYISNSAWGAIFFSIEMPVANVTERFFGMLDGCSGREVEQTFTEKGYEEPKKLSIEQFKSDMRNLFVVDSKIGLEDISAYINMIQDERKMKIGVVGIDYLGLMDGQGKDEYSTISALARGVKLVAKEINIPIIMLCQVSRKGGDGEVEVSLDMGRGSGAIEEGADFVLGLWQEEQKIPAGSYSLICRILKNRKGRKGKAWKLDLVPESMQIGKGSTEYVPPKRDRRKPT